MSWSKPLICLLAAGAVIHAASADVPRFEVDPFWPKPLPNNYYMGELGAVFVDAKDHVWVASRPRTLTPDQIGASLKPPTSECCIPAPPILEFDAAGTLVQTWGGPGAGYEWPDNEHGIFVDDQGNVWLGGNTTNSDNQILKFTHDGKFLMQIGHAKKSKGSLDTENLNRPAQIWVCEKTKRSVRRRRLPESPRDRVRRGHGQVQADVGRVRQQAGRQLHARSDP